MGVATAKCCHFDPQLEGKGREGYTRNDESLLKPQSTSPVTHLLQLGHSS